MMKNIVLFGLLSTILFVGCSPKIIEVVEQKEELKSEISSEKINVQKDIKTELSIEDTNAQKELEEEKKKVELKKKLDEEALINLDKKLNAKEINSYVIDENTPLILKNQSKDRAYE